jgi:homoserine kinase
VSYPSECTAFAPGSIGNVACGFDVLGLALEGPGDQVTARRIQEPGVRIASIKGDDGRLTHEPRENTAGAAAQAILDHLGLDTGVELHLTKGLPLSAGLGGSAASAVAAVLAVDGLYESTLPSEVLLTCALTGETVAAGAGHPDNAAPSLLGGLVLVPDWKPLRCIELRVPEELTAVHVHPHMEMETRWAREVLSNHVALNDAVAQWGNTAALVTGLFREDWELIARSVEDRIAEPLRASAIPGFYQVKEAALNHGALAASLSGSGPSLFALCRGVDRGEVVGAAMVEAFRDKAGIAADLLVSRGRAPGAKVIHVS